MKADVRPEPSSSAGLLAPCDASPCTLERFLPSDDLAHVVARYWYARWGCAPGKPLAFENLPSPNPFALFEGKNSRLYGVTTGPFKRALRGNNALYGVTFRYGAVAVLLRAPVARIRNNSVSLRDVLGDGGVRLAERLESETMSDRGFQDIEAFFRSLHLPKDDMAELACSIVEYIASHREVMRVRDVASAFGFQPRTLERLFNRYIGATAKWVLTYFRLSDAAGRIANDTVHQWRDLALELGYFDQAHFINDMRRILGHSPGSLAKRFAQT